MRVLDWIRSFWLPGDFSVHPPPKSGSNAPTVRPIEERIKDLAQEAGRKRRKPPPVRRSDGSLRKPKG